ncbi:MAG: hypothetical protein JWQ10_3215 [Herbaspirillum sp.]|jgi:hypothetical protein|nr:hypothetical protein [Herbaspirillum sp.]
MNNKQSDARDTQFAYKVRHALDRNLDRLPESTTQRLAVARALAMSRKKQAAPFIQMQHSPRLSGVTGGTMSFPSNDSKLFAWLGRLGVVLPILLGIVLFVGIYQSQERNRIAELADIDSEILSDELPISAYLDHGFKAYLAKQDQ